MSSDDKIEASSIDSTVEDNVIVIGDTMNSVFDYSSSYYTIDTITAPGTLTFDTSNINIANGGYSSSVDINSSGITMKSECDIKVGDRSLKEFMDRVEERLNILHPNPKLEDKWDELAELGKRYRELETEILEKEKMWNILKET